MSLMQYNNEQAEQAGIGQGASETGAYVGLLYAKYVTAQTGTEGLEFSLKGNQDVNYLTAWFKKPDGTDIRGGSNIIQAIMGLTKTRQINTRQATTQAGENIIEVPELCNKEIGFVLQKVLYTKQNGDDAYKFEIIMPFDARTRQTLVERNKNVQPTSVDKILETLRDKDDRKPAQNPNYGGNNYGHEAAHSPAPQSRLQQTNQPQNNNNNIDYNDSDNW